MSVDLGHWRRREITVGVGPAGDGRSERVTVEVADCDHRAAAPGEDGRTQCPTCFCRWETGSQPPIGSLVRDAKGATP